MSYPMISRSIAEMALGTSSHMNSLYNMGEKAVVARAPTDAFLVLDSADRSTSTSSTGTALPIPQSQPYNNFRLQKPENMVQGGFTRLQLTEVRFPYAIPNVNAVNNNFWVVVRTTTGDIKAQVFLPLNPVSLSGKEIAGQVQAILNASAVGGALGIVWAVIYYPDTPASDTTQGSGFSIVTLATATALAFALYPVEPLLNYPGVPTLSVPADNGSLLDVMGYNPVSNWAYLTDLTNTVPNLVLEKESLYAPLTYTQYIDIVSDKLTYYQNVKDGSTKRSGGNNIICRLYIADETSTAPTVGKFFKSDTNTIITYAVNPPPGSLPFVIHRQFQAPKQFQWDKDTAVDWIDIKLFDDRGRVLYVPPEGLPDFQITFKCTED